MAKKKKRNFYSTNPDWEWNDEDEDVVDTLPPTQQKLRVQRDRKQRKGKEVTLDPCWQFYTRCAPQSRDAPINWGVF